MMIKRIFSGTSLSFGQTDIFQHPKSQRVHTAILDIFHQQGQNGFGFRAPCVTARRDEQNLPLVHISRLDLIDESYKGEEQ